MKVENTAIYVGQDERIMCHRDNNMGRQQNKKSIFVGNQNGQEDTILMKKQQAQQKAMKIVGDTFDFDLKLDEQQEERREKVKELTEELAEIRGYISAQEEMPEEEMTLEMKMERAGALQNYKAQYSEIENEIRAENMTIAATKIERLKSSPMVKAQEAAEKVVESASEEIVDMLMQEAKDHIDEEQEEREEQAEKVAEEKKEEEERIQSARDEKEEAEVIAEGIKQAALDDTKKEIEEMLNKLKLLEEDIKGAAVDTTL